jgi:hypothetical protein
MDGKTPLLDKVVVEKDLFQSNSNKNRGIDKKPLKHNRKIRDSATYMAI